MDVANAVLPRHDQAVAFFSSPEDGPFVMVNLLKFKDRAEYEDGSDVDLTGREAYGRYGVGVTALVESLGGTLRFSGDVSGILVGEVEELWDAVALMEYPSYEVFMQMTRSPEYQAIEHHRIAGLAGQLNIRTKSQF